MTTKYTLRCVWPIVDETYTLRELIAQAVEQLPVFAADACATTAGDPTRWDIVDAADEPGWEAYPGCLLVTTVPADVDPVRRRELLSGAAEQIAEERSADRDRGAADAAVIELHAAGLSDSVIAVQLGMSRSTVTRTRERLRLPANFTPGGRRAPARTTARPATTTEENRAA